MDPVMNTSQHLDQAPPPRRDWLRRVETGQPAARSVITVTVDGVPLDLREGDTVAAAVMLAAHGVYRSTIMGEMPRAPFCMMGVCFDCLVEIDGVPNRQGCLVPARSGMRIVRQMGLASYETVAK